MAEGKLDNPESGESAEKGKLEGWVAPVATDPELREAVEKAFDYRGDVSLTLRDGRVLEGYIFDRHATGKAMGECYLRIMLKDRDEKVVVKYGEIAGLAFSGRDAAAGKSFETWMKKHQQDQSE
ncbi:MAG: hypothetical protein ACM359_18145 [Bacillota bacterium]